MSLIPSIELDGASGFLLLFGLIGIVVIYVYATALFSALLGGALFLIALAILYYLLVRLDSLLRHGRGRRQ